METLIPSHNPDLEMKAVGVRVDDVFLRGGDNKVSNHNTKVIEELRKTEFARNSDKFNTETITLAQNEFRDDTLPLLLRKEGRELDITLRQDGSKKRIRADSLIDAYQTLRMRSEWGGNTDNMMRIIAHCVNASIVDVETKYFTTQNSTLPSWVGHMAPDTKARIQEILLNLPSRESLQVNYSDKETVRGVPKYFTSTASISNGRAGTLPTMRHHLPDLLGGGCAIVEESLTPILQHRPAFLKQYREILNPSNGLSELSAKASAEFVKRGGQAPIVSNNHEEFLPFLNAALRQVGKPSIEHGGHSPFFSISFDEQRTERERAVDDIVRQYFEVLPPPKRDWIHFPLNVTSGSEGGRLWSVTPRGDVWEVTSSVPLMRGEREMLKPIYRNNKVNPMIFRSQNQNVTGAGDTAAAALTIANLWDIKSFLSGEAKRKDPIDESFLELASMNFASLLQRTLSSITYHSLRPDISAAPPDALRQVIILAAEQAIEATRQMWYHYKDASPPPIKLFDWQVTLRARRID